MKSKRLILALLLLLGTLLISGCDSSSRKFEPEDDGVPSEVSEEEEEPAEEEPAEEEPAEEPAEEEPAEEPAEEEPAEEEPVEQKINEGIFEVPAFGSSSEETEESTFIFGSSPEESESVGSISETEAAYFRAMLQNPSAAEMLNLEPPVELMDTHFELLDAKGDWDSAMEEVRVAEEAMDLSRIAGDHEGFIEHSESWYDAYERAKSAERSYRPIYEQAVREWNQYLSSYGLTLQDFSTETESSYDISEESPAPEEESPTSYPTRTPPTKTPEPAPSISEADAAYFRGMLQNPSVQDMTYLEPPLGLGERHIQLFNARSDLEDAGRDMEAANQAYQAHSRTRIFVEGDDEWDEYSRETSWLMDEMNRATNAAKSARNEYDRIYRQAVREWDQYLSSYGLTLQDFLP